jgi:hypothetical protein
MVCFACQHACTYYSDGLKERAGGSRMMNYSHFVLNGEWTAISKGNKPQMLGLLRQTPEVAIFALSGQKHLVLRARIGWWQIEEHAIRPDMPKFNHIYSVVDELYQGGFSKTEIESGTYSHRRVLDFGLERWIELDGIVKESRSTPVFDLALFLVTKQEEKGEKHGDTRRVGEQTSLPLLAWD